MIIKFTIFTFFFFIYLQFDADNIRFSVNRNEVYEEFRKILAEGHEIGPELNFLIYYTDPTDGDLLPINNDNNLARALSATKPVLRVFITREAEGIEDINGYGTLKPKNLISSILGGTPGKPKPLAISNPHDFRQVSHAFKNFGFRAEKSSFKFFFVKETIKGLYTLVLEKKRAFLRFFLEKQHNFF